MNNQFFKSIPFDIELAKKITNNEAPGFIVTKGGSKARIICFDRKIDNKAHLTVLIDRGNNEEGLICNLDGIPVYSNGEKSILKLEVPAYPRDYDGFKPARFQPCLVRDNEADRWSVAVCSGRTVDGFITFYAENGTDNVTWKFCIPLNKVTHQLAGFNKSYKALVKQIEDGAKRDAEKQ